MRHLLFPAFAALVMLGSAGAGAQEIRWHDSYQAATEEAVRTNKPLLVSFRCVP